MKKIVLMITLGIFASCADSSKKKQKVNLALLLLSSQKKETYQISFDSNGGTPVESLNIESGDFGYEPVIPEKQNKTFGGWELNGERFDFDSPITKNVTLKAIWENPIYKIDSSKSIEDFSFKTTEDVTMNSTFTRKSGWLSGDGLYSMTVDGVRSLGQGLKNGKKVLVWFADSIYGEIDENNYHHKTYSFVRNGLAVFPYSSNGEDLKFMTNNFTPFVPKDENKKGDCFWLQDGFVNQELNNEVDFFALRIEKTTEGVWGFKVAKSLVLRTKRNKNGISYEEVYLPWLITANAIYVNTNKAGAGLPDGYTYIYSVDMTDPFDFTKKNLRIARFKPEDVVNFSKWEWRGSDSWGSFEDSKFITNGVSDEMSVVQLKDGRYAMIFQDHTMGNRIGIKLSKTPYGEWSTTKWVYDIKLPDNKFFAYNAKAHPALSNENEIVISYNLNLNTSDEEYAKRVMHLVHPMFIKVKIL